jgi:hypothetical protein
VKHHQQAILDIGLLLSRWPEELSDHVSSGGHTTSYNESDRQSGMTIDQDSINRLPDHPG